MLETIRKYTGSFVVKLLFVILILSFGVWGVADVFRPGRGADWWLLGIGFIEISAIAGAIGTSSARVMVASIAQEEPLTVDAVFEILSEASQLRVYSRALEEKSRSLEAASAEPGARATSAAYAFSARSSIDDE